MEVALNIALALILLPILALLVLFQLTRFRTTAPWAESQLARLAARFRRRRW
jgi:hypothetical protein